MGSQDGLHCEPNFLSLRSGERIPRKPSSRLAALNLVAAEVLRRKELSPKGIRLVTSAATSRRFMGRVRERGSKYEIVFRQCFQGFPLSPALSPLVPRGEREKTKRRRRPVPLSPILQTPLYVPARLKNPLAEVELTILFYSPSRRSFIPVHRRSADIPVCGF